MSARLRLPTRLPELFADDRTLLGRFIDNRDEAAFAAIVKRHGGMVFGICRRALGDAHLAEDAFQAVFLVLARNPQAAAKASSLAGWLFGIARRVSLAARRHEQRRQKREQRIAAPTPANNSTDWNDLLRIVDEELAKIPDENRSALIACFLREQTHDEAARELGWSLSTLRRRLDRGKELLRARLTRRGATLSAALLAGLLAPSTVAAVPRRLLGCAGQETAASPLAVNLAAKAFGGLAAGKLVSVSIAALVLAGLAMVFAPSHVPVAEAAVPENHEIAAVVAPIPAPPHEWVAISGQVLFPASRAIPERREIKKTDGFVKDADWCFAGGRRLFFDNLIVEPKSRALINVVVWLRPDTPEKNAPFPRRKIHPDSLNAESVEHIVDIVDCQFHPRMTVSRSGDTLLFKNTAERATNVKYDSIAKGPGAQFGSFNVLIPAMTGSTKSPGSLETAIMPDVFSSSIYPWMRGFVWAFDHPYSAVTDAEGKFRIANAPVGTWRLMMWHEEFGYCEGRLHGIPVNITDGPMGTMNLGSREFIIHEPKK
ncbi:MAG TPA: RNA polymerase sigma factor [Urbifossiella sp.]|jgi:RNA polymerase sigma factor (sigma-70 family)